MASKTTLLSITVFSLTIFGITSAHAETINVSIPQGSATPECEATNSCYIPASTSISVNDQIVWTNNDSASHTVTSGTPSDGPDGAFDSSLFMAGNTFSQTFGQAGEFPYFCLVHPWMIGEIIVTSPAPNDAFKNLGALEHSKVAEPTEDIAQPEIEDTFPPETIKLSGPQGTIESSAAGFEFSSSEENSSFECSLDGSAFFACSGQYKSPDLVDGPHTLSVRAIDGSNNEDNTPIVYSWIVDTSPSVSPQPPSDNNLIFIIIGIAVAGGVGAMIAMRRKSNGGSKTPYSSKVDDYSFEDSKLK